jgi:hypothetical protein
LTTQSHRAGAFARKSLIATAVLALAVTGCSSMQSTQDAAGQYAFNQCKAGDASSCHYIYTQAERECVNGNDKSCNGIAQMQAMCSDGNARACMVVKDPEAPAPVAQVAPTPTPAPEVAPASELGLDEFLAQISNTDSKACGNNDNQACHRVMDAAGKACEVDKNGRSNACEIWWAAAKDSCVTGDLDSCTGVYHAAYEGCRTHEGTDDACKVVDILRRSCSEGLQVACIAISRTEQTQTSSSTAQVRKPHRKTAKSGQAIKEIKDI